MVHHAGGQAKLTQLTKSQKKLYKFFLDKPGKYDGEYSSESMKCTLNALEEFIEKGYVIGTGRFVDESFKNRLDLMKENYNVVNNKLRALQERFYELKEDRKRLVTKRKQAESKNRDINMNNNVLTKENKKLIWDNNVLIKENKKLISDNEELDIKLIESKTSAINVKELYESRIASFMVTRVALFVSFYYAIIKIITRSDKINSWDRLNDLSGKTESK